MKLQVQSHNYMLPRFTTFNSNHKGQLLLQEVIEHLKYRGPVQRLLISDLNRPAVSRALAKLRFNKEFQPLDDQGRFIDRTPADALTAQFPGTTGQLTQQEKR